MHIILFNQRNKLQEHLITMSHRILIVHQLTIIERTEPMGQCQQQQFLLILTESIILKKSRAETVAAGTDPSALFAL